MSESGSLEMVARGQVRRATESELIRRKRMARVTALVGRTLAHLFLLVGSLIMIFPFAWMLSSSLKSNVDIFVYPPQPIPNPARWDNYLEVFRRMPFALFFFNSAKIGVLCVIGALLSCSLGAYAFARMEFPGRNVLFMILLSTIMIPFQVTLIPVYILMRALGWLDTHYPLWVPSWFGAAFGTFLLRQFFMTIPQDLEDAARIDGCSHMGIYWRIFMPLAGPALATLAVFTFMWSWNSLIMPVIFLGTWEKMTLTIGIAHFRGMYRTEWNYLMAGSAMSVVPILILFATAQQYFVRSVVISGIKG